MKRVFILGAGCSVEDGVPLIDTFYREMEREFKNHHPEFDRFRILYNLDNTNIEEFLSCLDLHTQLDSNFLIDPADPSKGRYNLQEMRDEFVVSIGRLVENKVKEKTDVNSSRNYTNFYYSLNKEDTIISFNWDILLDSVAYSINPLKFGGDKKVIDYGSEFYMMDSSGNMSDDPQERVGVKLLKLHGSLNWFYCSNCQKKLFTFQPDLYENYKKGNKVNCPACQTNLDFLIIPPTFLKRFDKENSPLIPIWQEAFKALKNCDEIIIVGYSFPRDDIHFRHFFRSCLSTSDVWGAQDEPLRIKVLNYKPYLRDQLEFEDQYKGILHDISIKIEPKFTYKKFSEFAYGGLQ